MTPSPPVPSSRPVAAREPRATALDGARIRAAFQPIEDLRTGAVVGFEALARLVRGGETLSPAAFLDGLPLSGLETLFREMLDQALALRGRLAAAGVAPYVSVNVEAPLVLADGFPEILRAALDRHACDGGLTLELLEGHATTDFARMSERLAEVRALGVAVAIDDIGSAYASLITLRDLPVDMMKLDHSFARGLGERPRDLHFVLSLQGLARSIGKRLVVEGVETPEIRDALRVLGVAFGQGYAIARPMPAEAVPGWLAGRPAPERTQDREPRSLLGAYAGHLRVVEACHALMGQPMPVSWRETAKDPHACSIGAFFDRRGLHGTAFGLAHRRFHEVMALYESDRTRWQAAVDAFRDELERALAGDDAARFRCEAAAA